VTGHTHSLDEWLAMVCIAVSGYASFSAPYFLLVDADLKDFDPRPPLRRLVQSEAVYPLLREWDNACHAARETARDAAALLILLTTRPQGVAR
jgi:hypothetical protein